MCRYSLWESLRTDSRYVLRFNEEGKITGVSEWKSRTIPEDPETLEFSEAPSLLKYFPNKAGLHTMLRKKR